MLHELSITTTQRTQMINITASVQQALETMEIKNGICVLFIPHTTAGITINENADPAVQSDSIQKINALIPKHEGYSHTEGNSDAHIKTSLYGTSCMIIIDNGSLKLGTWQGIFFAEWDGPRQRKAWMKVITQ